MPNPRTQRERERARQAERQRQRDRDLRRAQRRRAMIGASCVIVIIAVLVGVIIAGQRSNEMAAATTSTTADPLADLRQSTTSSLPTGPPASLPVVAPGATLAGQASCPNPDGSSPRTTGFTAPIPMCISAGTTFDAVMKTSVGEMKFLLNPEEGLQTVNSFVFLAGYHYWDGAPLTTIRPEVTFVVTNPVESGPGFTVPNELQPAGTIFPMGRLAMVARPDNTLDPGTFQVALGEEAAGLPRNTPSFGIMLDGLETLQAIRKGGSQSGVPTGNAILIESITISPAPASASATSQSSAASQ